MSKEQRFVELVEDLKTLTPQAIADLLVSEGIKGCRFKSEECPLSEYIRKELDVSRVTTAGRTIRLADNYKNIIEINIQSTGVYEFICKFDNGYYSELVRTPSVVYVV